MTAEVVGERPPLGVRLWLALRFAAGPVSAHCSCGWCQESRSLAWRLRLRAAWVLLRWRVAQLRRWDVGENRVHRSFVAAAFALAGAGELVASAGVA